MLKRSGVSSVDLRAVYCCFIRPILEYASPVWHSSLPSYLQDRIEQIQRRATKIILPGLSYDERLNDLRLPLLLDRRDSLCYKFYKSVLANNSSLTNLFPKRNDHRYSLRNPRTFSLFKCKTQRFKYSFLPYAVGKWDAAL